MTGPTDWFPLPLHAEQDHHEALAVRRRDAPVQQVRLFAGAAPVWVVARYDDVAGVLNDDASFSLDVVDERYGAVLGGSMVTLAPTARRALRRVLLQRMRPEAEAVAEVVGAVVRGCVDTLADGPRTLDLVPALAAQVPARVLTRLLGLPEQQWPQVAGLAAGAAHLIDDPRAAVRAARSLRRLLAAQVEQPQGGSDDLVAALRAVEVDGARLDAAQVVASLLLLSWAGTETAFPALSTCLHAVLSTPGEADRVRRCPSRALAAADEALRWESPVQVTSRRVAQPVVVGGTPLAVDDVVLLHLGSANRDERRFTQPDRFDPDRTDGPALAFGGGPHRCLGAHLARVEVATAVRELLLRFPELVLDPASPLPQGAVVRSPRRVQVHLTGAAEQDHDDDPGDPRRCG